MGRGSSKAGKENVITTLQRKHGVDADISNAGKYEKEAEDNLRHLDRLLDEYNSTAVGYSIVTSQSLQEAGGAYMLNGKTDIMVTRRALRNNKATDELNLGDNQYLGATYHEFAHSLTQIGEGDNKDFWKEIKALKKDYENQINKPNREKISSYASKNAEEFFAEAFTQAKLGKNPSKYSMKVLEVTDKYFKKRK